MPYPSNKDFTPHFRYNGFITKRTTDIPELCARLVELEHEHTKAQILHIQNDDPENLFCLSLRTLPSSSNGVAHILEHMTLCGSKKFPVKDPFFSMTRRSLNTFMNALTGADFTCYPAASQIEKDFYNLLDVYCDAVFFPNLDQISFLQEGHRLEFTKPNSARSALIRKGVVYNEMKGALASPMTRLHEHLSKLLFKGSSYAVNSGGDPKDIPSLTLNELKAFHQTYYHPSRCLFYFYGTLPLAQHLDFIQKRVLKDSQPLPPLEPIKKPIRLQIPQYKEGIYPHTPGSEEALEYTALGWLTYPCTDVEKILQLSILDCLLMETDASPLKRKILESKLSKRADSAVETEIVEAPYYLTLTGTHDTPQKIEATIREFLKEIAKTGFAQKEIDRVLHQVELDRKEIQRDQAPFGLTLFWRCGLLRQHGIDPLVGLETEKHFSKLRKALKKNPHLFSDILHEALIENPHLIVLRMTPSQDVLAQEDEQEKTALAHLKKQLSQQEKQQIIEETTALQKRQNSKEDSSCLPSISMQDIAKKGTEYQIIQQATDTTHYYFSNTFTNHISYVNIAIPLPENLFKTAAHLKLYSLFLPQVGCQQLSWQEALEYAQEYTGGITSFISLNPSIDNPNKLNPHLHIYGKSLSQNLEKLLTIMSWYIHDVRLDETDRLHEILTKHATSLESSLVSSSLRYASIESERHFSYLAHLQWLMGGRMYLSSIRTLANDWKKQHKSLLNDLKAIKETLLTMSNVQVVATCDASSQKRLLKFFKDNPFSKRSRTTHWKANPPTQPENSLLALENGSAISFSSFVCPTIPYTSKEAPYAALLAPLLNNLYLHRTIREQGGAYGGGASYNPSSATFSFYTYRDPNIWTSFCAFQEALQMVARGDFTTEDLNEAKRECIQSLDDPVSPSAQADIAFTRLLEGKTPELRNSFRTKLLSAKKADLTKISSQILEKGMPSFAFTTAAGKQMLNRELQKFKEIGAFTIKSL